MVQPISLELKHTMFKRGQKSKTSQGYGGTHWVIKGMEIEPFVSEENRGRQKELRSAQDSNLLIGGTEGVYCQYVLIGFV